MEQAVTVGLDGSVESFAAARWAAGEALRHHRTLCLLHAWPMLSATAVGAPSEADQNYWSERLVHDARSELHEHYPELDLTEALVAEDATTALLEAAARSWMLVLGSRGLGPAESFFLGDIAMDVVGRAERPVTLVRAGTSAEPSSAPNGGRVVVGLSLHGPCDGLLDFAFDAAAVRGVPLHAVHGRSLPVAAYAPWGVDPAVCDEIRAAALKELGDVLRPWHEKFPGVRMVHSVRLESPARALVEAAPGTDLLVIGRRGHRPALAPRLGNVGHAAAHHAACPLAIVPHD
ncbi:universal stress protein [Streptomyces sp. NPDC059649]|uniref:universal stress protein n=1 Tax=Streptomyces sp. NPDC059649 TaxID=3346895 RepID=UPI00368F8571